MARLIGILATIASLALLGSCSSGVSNTGAGARNTDCKSGDLNLICTATITMETTSIDAYASDTNMDGTPDELLTTQTGDMTITITDPLGTFSHIFQGATFETYDVSFESGRADAPKLGTRRYTQTMSITLSAAGTGSNSVTIPIVDLVTKKRFRDTAKFNIVYPYVVTVRATGRDFATNHTIVVVARINVEFADFLPSVPTPMTPSGASIIDYGSGLKVAHNESLKDVQIRWQAIGPVAERFSSDG